ncbi:MAG: protease modulator HflC [Alphaproteobacteria bacterium]|nr:protease modulator HflC [Alphaproteobacteria bacterium]
MAKSHAFLLFILLAGFLVVTQSAFVVTQGEQALVLQFGKPVAEYPEPGLKFKTPFIQDVQYFDRRALNVNPEPEQIILADQKPIIVDTFARYRITTMLKFRNIYGSEATAETQLDNTINSATRSVLGTATLTDLLSTKRDALMKAIREQVNDSVKENGIQIVDVRISRADLPQVNSQAVYKSMQAARQKESTQYRSEGKQDATEIRADADKQRTILLANAQQEAQKLRGEGDAEATRIYAEAYNKDPKFYAFYRSLEAYRNTLSGGGTTMILSPDSDFLRYFKNERGDK